MDLSTLPTYPDEENDLLVKPPREGDPREFGVVVTCCVPFLFAFLLAAPLVLFAILWIFAEIVASDLFQILILDAAIVTLGRRLHSIGLPSALRFSQTNFM
jgi:hypothetical protein